MKGSIRLKIEAARLRADHPVKKTLDPGGFILRAVRAAAVQRYGKVAIWENFPGAALSGRNPSNAIISMVIRKSGQFEPCDIPGVWKLKDWNGFTREDPKRPEWVKQRFRRWKRKPRLVEG